MDISFADADRLFSKLADYPDGVAVVNGRGVVRFANPLALLFYSAGSGTLEGKTLGLAVRPGETVEQEIGGRTLEVHAAPDFVGRRRRVPSCHPRRERAKALGEPARIGHERPEARACLGKSAP